MCMVIVFLLFKFGRDKSRSKSLPALFTIIGVFGTFLGIALGLSDFDVNANKIEESVAVLLEAQFCATSIIGIAALLV